MSLQALPYPVPSASYIELLTHYWGHGGGGTPSTVWASSRECEDTRNKAEKKECDKVDFRTQVVITAMKSREKKTKEDSAFVPVS